MLASNSSSQILNHNPFSCRYDCWVQEPIWLKRWTIQSTDHWKREPKTDFYVTYCHLSWPSWPLQRSLCCAQGIYIIYHYISIPAWHNWYKTSYSRLRVFFPSSRNYGHRIKVLRSKDHLPSYHMKGGLIVWLIWHYDTLLGTITYPIRAGTNLSRWFSNFPFPKVAYVIVAGYPVSTQPLLNFEKTGIIGPSATKAHPKHRLPCAREWCNSWDCDLENPMVQNRDVWSPQEVINGMFSVEM